MGYSTKIYFRKDYVKQDGTCSIYLQVIIDRSKKAIALGLDWPVQLCEDSQTLCRPKSKNCTDADDMNILLRDKLGQANDIFKYYRMSDQKLTMERFMDKWTAGRISHADFLKYFEKRTEERFAAKEFGLETYKKYSSTLSWLKQFKSEISFADFNEKWAYAFDNFLKRKIKTRSGDSHNTRWGYHKVIRTILNYAAKMDGISFTEPYKYFKITMKKGKWQALSQSQVEQLYCYYQTASSTDKIILRRFLFGVATSLRIGDLRRVHTDWREGDAFEFEPMKTRLKTGKRVRIPLSSFAKELWADAVKEHGHGYLFREITEQAGNRCLKRIAKKLGITTNIHNHVSRHTWTTLFLNAGGSLRTAQAILAHESVRTTEVYDHMNYQQVVKELDKMEFIK